MTNPPPPTPDTHLTGRAKWLAMSGIGMGVLMGTLDTSIVNISLPTLVEAFQTDFATIQWVVLSYVLVITSLLLGAARLGDMISKKKLYQAGLGLFVAGSLISAISPTVYWLIGARALQGLGATFTTGLGTAIITEIVHPRERGRALGIMGSIVSIGIATGPPLGGLIIGLAGWHWVFLVNIPVGIAALVIVARFIPGSLQTHRHQQFDLAGALVLFASLGMYAFGMTYGQQNGFGLFLVRGLLIAALAGFILFLVLERRHKMPMVDLSLFKNALFGMNLLMAFFVFIVLAGMFILPFYLELVRNFPTQLVGLLMMGFPISMGLISPVAGMLSDRFGSRGISLIGLLMIIGGCLTMSTLESNTPALGYILRSVPLGLGMGLFQSPNNNAIMGSVPRERLGISSGLLALSRTLGQTTGLPLMGTIFSAQVAAIANLPQGTDITSASPAAIVSGIQGTFQIAAFFILASTIVAISALWIDNRRKKAAVLAESESLSK